MRRTYPLDSDTARRVATRRKAAGMTQNALALRVNVSESTITKIETLRVPLAPTLLAAIENALAEAEQRGQGQQQEARAV